MKSEPYDQAEIALKNILRCDPYNATAYRRLREVQLAKYTKRPVEFHSTIIFLGRRGISFNLYRYQFLMLAGLPLLAAINLGFALYRRKLGLPASVQGA